MKGIVFNLLEDAVTDAHGEDAWDAVLERTELSGDYTALGNYADGELTAMVGAISERTGAAAEDVVRGFGRAALPGLASRYPEFFAGHSGTRSFLLTLDEVIHREVRKLYPGAQPPGFTFEEPSDGVLVMHYHSARRLCAFAEGMVEAAAAHFGESVTITRPACALRGDAHCTLVVGFGAR